MTERLTHTHTFLGILFNGFPGGAEVKVSACKVGDLGSISGLGRSSGEGNGNLLQYSCLENALDRGAWQAPWGHKEFDMTEQLTHNVSRTVQSTQ